MTEPRRVLLPEIESGNAAADRIYRRLIDRRRRLIEPDELAAPGAEPPNVGHGQDDRRTRPAGAGAAAADATAEGPGPATTTHGGMPMTDHTSHAKPPMTGGADDPIRAAAGRGGSPADQPGQAPRQGDADQPPAHVSSVFGDPGRAGSPRAEIDPEGPADDVSDDFRQRAGRGAVHSRERRHAFEGGSSGQAWLHPRLTDWEPQSQTMRFIKDHPALALAIGVPTLLILTRNGGLKRVIRYASSPAGMSRIRQGMALAATLGLLNNRR
jgi:hypothetical protein